MPMEVAPAGRGHAFPEYRSSPAGRMLHRGPDYLRRQMEGSSGARVSAVERLAADRLKYVKSPQVAGTGVSTLSSASGSSSGACSTRSGGKGAGGAQNETPEPTPPTGESGIPRRSSSKRQTRPDSLLIYRQKPKGDPAKGGDPSRGGFVRRLFQGSAKEKGTSPDTRVAPQKEDSEEAARGPVPDAPQRATPATPEDARRRAGVHRSQSDISSRYSKAFSEFDTFFRYCGLEPEVIEALGRERFSPEPPAARVRSVSMATSDSGFSRHSGGEQGLQEDELQGQPHGGPSVIERNARIIKWLYGCRAARQAQGPRELA
ncbi:protein FAM110C [Ambystoma mexicanum]|uniref:protein FAM110C n=1 Tax=Ambystoma mexicanum TaxID=8296 RepID=UPI0037E7999B